MDGNVMPQPSRIILAIETRLLREMLKHAITRSPYLRLVGEVSNEGDLVSMVEQKDAQWVILSLSPDGDLPETAEALLAAEPSLSILAVASDGSQVKLGWKQPQRESVEGVEDGQKAQASWTESREMFLDDLSLEGLIAVLREGPIWEPNVPKRHKH